MALKRRIFSGPFHVEWLVVFSLMVACVDQLQFNIPVAKSQTIVDGFISTQSGNYTVKLSTSLDMNADSLILYPIEKASIILFDDLGNKEDLIETSPGVYATGGAIRGQVGHAYHIRIQTLEGKIFESMPDTIYGAGHLDSIHYRYEARIDNHGFGNLPADVFNISADGSAVTNESHSIRWRFTSSFMVITNPELYFIWAEGFTLMDPLPCSGYRVDAGLGGGVLTQYSPCTCCTCYVTKYEALPTVSDGKLVHDGLFTNVKVGEIPINNITFSNKYIVQVEQMSLSATSTLFYRMLRQQKEGASNIFQPSFGRIKGNIHAVNSTDEATGLFWATDISARIIALDKTYVPYVIPVMETDYLACTHFINSSTLQPSYWK